MFPVVQSQADCNFNQQISVVFNCANTLIFESNTDALIIFTDIANNATYSLTNNILTLNVESPDVVIESPMIFSINEESNVLTRISDDSNDLWKLEIEGVAPWDL